MKTDSQIQTDVMQELKWDPSVSGNRKGPGRVEYSRCYEHRK